VFTGVNNKERMTFTSYYKGQSRLYTTTTDKPLHPAEKTTLPSAPILAAERSMYRSTSEFFLDEEKIERTSGFKLFVDDINVAAGVSSDQLFLSRSTIFMSDMLGNRRFIASLDSVDTFSNFDFLYLDMHRRLNWGARLYDNRAFFNTFDVQSQDLNRRQVYRETGALGLLSYPFTRYHRIEVGAGYLTRQYSFPDFQNSTDRDGDGVLEFEELEWAGLRHNFPLASSTFSGDSAVYKFFGPVSGRRYQASLSYAPDLDEGGTLTSDLIVDWREYKQLSSRTLIAARFFGAYSQGNFPNFYYFGGLNTVRGYDFRTIVGSQAGFANLEFRFPLVDLLATPFVVIQQMRGVFFFDIGAAKFEDQPFNFRDDEGRFVDAKASVGWGIAFHLFGLPLNWDFAKRFDGKEFESGFRTSFWVGQTF
jgi:outer membrane protein assembly factor BamA